MSEEGVESAPASDEAFVKMSNPLSDGDTEPELVDEADDGFRFLADSWNPGMNAPPDAVVEWMGRTEESILTGGSLRGLQEILGKVLLIAMVSSKQRIQQRRDIFLQKTCTRCLSSSKEILRCPNMRPRALI